MKNLLLFIALITFLSSCQVKYDNTIHATQQSQSPIGYDTNHLTNGNPTPIYETLYTVSPTWSQAWHWQAQRGNRWIFWLFAGIAVICLGVYVYYTTFGGESKASLVFPAAAIVSVIIMASSIEWERWNMDQTITKTQYDQLIQKDGDLHEFWNSVRIK